MIKKLILILTAVLILCPKVFAETSENISLLTNKGFFDRPKEARLLSPYEEIRRTFYQHLKYSNNYEFENLKSLYAEDYINADGINKEIYFDLVKKTWAAYPDIKYRIDINNIEINEDRAVVQINEYAIATTNSKSEMINERGTLESFSDTVYYLERINGQWLITSDHIIFEKTFLRYGSAKYLEINLNAPTQVQANTQYTTSLKIEQPKDSFIIASIGQEKITYPQVIAEEVFRKLPESGILERVFTSNDKNINEYTVASFGITKAEIKDNKEIKIYISGLGFAMLRVNVIPKNNFIKASKDEETK